MNVPLAPEKSSSEVWRQSFSDIIFPRLAEFKPDFIFVPAGFDAHEGDIIHCMDTKITEFDYHWVTQNLVAIANTYSEGRLVSVLEGGYNTTAGPLSPLAQSIF